MSKDNIIPKLLPPERIIEIYRIYEACGQVFEGSHISEVFGHIAALTALIKQREQQLIDMIKAVEISPVEA